MPRAKQQWKGTVIASLLVASLVTIGLEVISVRGGLLAWSWSLPWWYDDAAPLNQGIVHSASISLPTYEQTSTSMPYDDWPYPGPIEISSEGTSAPGCIPGTNEIGQPCDANGPVRPFNGQATYLRCQDIERCGDVWSPACEGVYQCCFLDGNVIVDRAFCDVSDSSEPGDSLCHPGVNAVGQSCTENGPLHPENGSPTFLPYPQCMNETCKRDALACEDWLQCCDYATNTIRPRCECLGTCDSASNSEHSVTSQSHTSTPPSPILILPLPIIPPLPVPVPVPGASAGSVASHSKTSAGGVPVIILPGGLPFPVFPPLPGTAPSPSPGSGPSSDASASFGIIFPPFPGGTGLPPTPPLPGPMPPGPVPPAPSSEPSDSSSSLPAPVPPPGPMPVSSAPPDEVLAWCCRRSPMIPVCSDALMNYKFCNTADAILFSAALPKMSCDAACGLAPMVERTLSCNMCRSQCGFFGCTPHQCPRPCGFKIFPLWYPLWIFGRGTCEAGGVCM